MDQIVISGIISRINKKPTKNQNDKYVWFEICQNKQYKKDGLLKKETSYFSAMFDKKYLDCYEEILQIGKLVVVTGIPKSYFDLDEKKCFYIRVLNIRPLEEVIEESEESGKGPIISYDTDGIMLWNGKRCEAILPSQEEKSEIERIIKSYGD